MCEYREQDQYARPRTCRLPRGRLALPARCAVRRIVVIVVLLLLLLLLVSFCICVHVADGRAWVAGTLWAEPLAIGYRGQWRGEAAEMPRAIALPQHVRVSISTR